jgi:hypothetical protein
MSQNQLLDVMMDFNDNFVDADDAWNWTVECAKMSKNTELYPGNIPSSQLWS